MRSRLRASCVVLAALAGCYRANGFQPCAIRCSADERCQGGDPCGADGLCHAGAGTCGLGADAAGASDAAGGDAASADAPMTVDGAMPDGAMPGFDAAPMCIGSLFQECFTGPPVAHLTIEGALDTSRCEVSGGMTTSQPGSPTRVCVFVATDIDVAFNQNLLAYQSQLEPIPLVIVASDTIRVTNSIDVSSHAGASPGPGADDTACLASGDGTADLNGGGGGGGGSFGGGGGSGGSGDAGSDAGGPPGQVIASVTSVRGGCPGGLGGNQTGSPTPGGGAIYLLAGSSITVTGNILAGGGGGLPPIGAGGGMGGSSGGMIALEAPTLSFGNVALLAQGGGGAGGTGSTSAIGGSDAATSAGFGAPGGAGGGIASANSGGAGSLGSAPGQDGAGGLIQEGGGGGGGGAGVILLLGSLTSIPVVEPPFSSSIVP